MPPASTLVEGIAEAMSIKYNNLVYDLKRQGHKIIVLSLGEAFFDLPLLPFGELPFPSIYHYSHSRGVPELRTKLAEHYSRFGVPVDPEREIVVTAGSKAAIYFAIKSVVNPGDEVLIPEPAWVSFPEQVRLCHAVPMGVPYDVPVQDYGRYITPRTRLVILNNPHNPTGRVFTRAELEHVMRLAEERDFYVLMDEAYSDFVVDEPFVSMGSLRETKRHLILCNSISKNFGISGWRIGYAISNPSMASQILKVNQHILTCPPTILAYYIAKHFDEIRRVTAPQIANIVRIRREVYEYVRERRLGCLPGTATFYMFVSIFPSKLGSEAFCNQLLAEHHVCAVPGIGYGASCDAFIRVSVGTESVKDIKEGIDRIEAMVRRTS